MKSHQPNIIDNFKKGLHENRITMRSVVAILMLVMLVIVFFMSDLTGRHRGSMNMGSAAEVNGEIISLKDFQDEENRMSQYYSQLFGGQFDMNMQKAMLRGEVMNTIVSKTLASQAAEKEGIYATDAEVRHMITQELPYFKKDGVFQSDAYKAILSANKLTPGEFENKLRQDIKNQRSRQLFESSLNIGQLQKMAEQEIHSAKLNLDYIQLSAADYNKTHEVSTEIITKKLADADFKKKVQDYFNSNQASYETKEQVKASHILVKADASNDEAAKSKAQSILKRLEKEDFGKVAAQVSDDPGSKVKNGDLGYFSRGRMVKEFDEAVFSLPVGKVSGLVKTPFGYHIIKVTDKKAFAKADFDNVKNEIAKKMISDDDYATLIKSIESDLAAGKTDDVLKVLSQFKMSWKETGFFDIAVEAIPGMNSSQAMKTALELTKTQPVAKKLVREGDVQFLIKLKDTKFETADVKRQDKELLERQKSTEAYRSWVETFKKSAKIETNSALMKE